MATRRACLVALSGVLAGRAAAEPCKVTISLAPADVRAEIEAWVRAEPRCARELEVRVVPADDGLQLSARDPEGRVRERVVPDAQSAAVLVVSWMADASAEPERPEHARVVPPPEAPPPVLDAVDVSTLGAPTAVVSVALVARAPRRWLSVGALSSRERVGMRGHLDLVGGSRLSVGVAGGWRERRDRGGGEVGQARVVVATSRSFGRLSLRAQLGVGADFAAADDDHMDRDAKGVSPAADASVLATLRIGRAWGFVGGPMLESARETGRDVSIYVGVQRGL